MTTWCQLSMGQKAWVLGGFIRFSRMLNKWVCYRPSPWLSESETLALRLSPPPPRKMLGSSNSGGWLCWCTHGHSGGWLCWCTHGHSGGCLCWCTPVMGCMLRPGDHFCGSVLSFHLEFQELNSAHQACTKSVVKSAFGTHSFLSATILTILQHSC